MRPKSKLIKYPEFSELPQTDLANVPENITTWLNKGKLNLIKKFCRPSGLNEGYRFVNAEELSEIRTEHQTILGKECDLIFCRRVETRDSFCPLYFTEWYVQVDILYKGHICRFKNDNQLRNFFKSISLTTT